MHQSEKAIFEGFVGERYHGIGVYLKKFMSMFSETLKEDKISFQPNKNRYINGDRKSELKLNEDILIDMCTILLKKQEECAAERKRKLKERTYEKLSRDMIKMNEVINSIQNRSINFIRLD
ncbi:unnamed protein product [Chironomus riparius]|uniref:Uncharacterized protein n=1 Tax=Chironomus riparius TaxID=315576 RepID=A0A9N9RZT7_9DIPT|nr:unnamed protein product [Chironomus riparius]